MMEGRRAVVVVMVVVVMVGASVVGAATSLRCGEDCTCEKKEDLERDYIVRCNATTLEEVTVSDSIFASVLMEGRRVPVLTIANNYTTYRTHVLVEGTSSLTLTFTVHFFTMWRQFYSSSLDVITAGRVIFPDVPPFEHDSPLGHYFAGLGLADVTTSEVPGALFSGKQTAGLRLRNSTVGRLPAGLLKGVASLHYLEIVNSTVGVLEGPLGEPALGAVPSFGVQSRPVLLAHSTVGLVNRGAVRLRARQDQKIVLEGVSLGRVESGAVEVVGAGEVVVKQCTAARMEADALLLGQDTRLTLAGNWLTVQPGALTRYPCGADDHLHHISGNHFTLLHNTTAAPVSLSLQHGGQQERQRVAASLGTAVHHTCVAANLPAPPLPSPAPWTAVTAEQMAALGAVGVVIGATVACLAIVAYMQRCRRGRDPRANPLPPVIMSRIAIPEEPIYEEALPAKPPALPAPHAPLPPVPQPSSPHCGTLDRDACCGSSEGRTTRPTENHYVTRD